MRISLRWKILWLAVLIPASLGLAMVWTVNRSVTAHVNSSSIHESLQHTVAVFENGLRTRWKVLSGGAHVIARDPRFFSVLMLRSSQRDHRFLTTVRGMARDFNRITQTDLFEVLDRRGNLLVSVGASSTSKPARDSLVRAVLRRNRPLESVLVDGDAHYQVSMVPVLAGAQRVGVLLLGVRIGSKLARELRAEMQCEVTFLSGTTITGTSLQAEEDQKALLLAIRRLRPAGNLGRLPVQQVDAPRASYLTLVRHLPASDTTAHQLYVMQRAFDPEIHFLQAMRKGMIALAALALVAALISGLVFSEQILRPLQSLVRGAQEMERGNFDHPLQVTRRDEIGYLVERFVEMRQRERTYLDSLEQAMQLKSQFLSIASHELRTPISVLIGYNDLLATGQLGSATPEQQEAFERMRSHLERLTVLAEDAARFARVKSERLVLDFQPHRAEDIVRRASALARAAGARRSVIIDTECEPIDRPLEADGPRLEDAIFQLVTNAIRFTPDGGRVEVRAREVDERLQVVVKDTGVGMPQKRLETLLSVGLSTLESNNHRSATGLEFNLPGLGLGLLVARAIVEGHGGSIQGESRLGEGSTFVIEIPMGQAAPRAAAA
jgi:signal transduction histidine kinase